MIFTAMMMSVAGNILGLLFPWLMKLLLGKSLDGHS